MTNVVNLEDYRKEKKPPLPPPIMAFEPGGFYIYPDLGVMAHCLFITDKSIAYDKEPLYILEDQFGNVFAEVMDDESCIGWHELQENVYITTLHRIKAEEADDDPEPPTPRAG